MVERDPTSSLVERSDEDLVGELQAGRVDAALTELDRRYGRRIYHFVHGMIRDVHLAQDVTQEVFEKVLRKHDLYRPGTNFRAWLFEVARNQALTALRSRQRLPRPVSSLQTNESLELLDTVAAPADARGLEEEEFMAAFQAAVAELPEHYRSVFELCVRQGKPYVDAGQELGLPTGTVAIRIMRARKRLFTALQHHLGRLRRPPACFQ
ncbi:MAG: sigma-70 family RNA polymerase sigma factor [Planctomycetes bacterium]|nr:sigma-70 family RNA polymerase sigma factor [Planctomycetota bacterium]